MNGDLDDAYLQVFDEQESLGIIEKIPCGFNSEEHKFISYILVIRTYPLVNHTKIRPVFNAGFKTSNKPSLNDATFAGIDLMNDLLGLIIYFRTNSHVLLADIAIAFVQIRLNKVSDKNCFRFCLYKAGQFKYYRYYSLIFEFVN